jgi:hypothetical protein
MPLTPGGRGDKSACLINLGKSYQRWFQLPNEPGDIRISIDYFNEAVALVAEGDPDKPFWLNNLSGLHHCQFISTGEIIPASIRAPRQAFRY